MTEAERTAENLAADRSKNSKVYNDFKDGFLTGVKWERERVKTASCDHVFSHDGERRIRECTLCGKFQS